MHDAVEVVPSLPTEASLLHMKPADATQSDESCVDLQLTLAPQESEAQGVDGRDVERLSMTPNPGLLDQSDPAFWDGLSKMLTSPRTSPRYMSRERVHIKLVRTVRRFTYAQLFNWGGWCSQSY